MSTQAPVPVQPTAQPRRKRRKAAKAAAPKPAARPDFTTLLLFAPAILIGALLLFAVQPLIARYVLPWFGGGPGVWTACMLFFQVLLLAGYLYAHLSVKHLPTRGQILLHLLLLIGALALIPIVPSPKWKPIDVSDPVGRILLLLGVTIGLPYFVLSATSPLLQAWFVRVQPGVSPYRLFALSNLGSLLALIGYPTILEPLFTRQQQAWTWSGGLVLFALLCLACGRLVWKRTSITAVPVAVPEGDSRTRERAGSIALWLALPMVASVLLLATTNTLTEDVAVTPLLWVIPLALYLLTFVIAFENPRWYARRAVLILLPLCTLWVLRLQWLKTGISLGEQFAGYLVAMFVVCLFCHGELARLKPDPQRLTRYYLMISLGGALGGVFAGLIAPHIFNRLLELPLSFVAAGSLAFACLRDGTLKSRMMWAGVFTGAAVLLLLSGWIQPLVEGSTEHVIARSRNFYGTLLIAEGDIGGRGNPADLLREMKHGSTSHGAQFVVPERHHETTLYYREGSGVSFALHATENRPNRKIGLVGLGVGTLAAYAKAGDELRFYEINPDVERLAREHFSSLADTPAKTHVILGDARLSLERESSQQFDVLVLDAFNGDAIPTHLLTTEAFDIYASHLKLGGILAVHFSNRSVDLGPLLLHHAKRLNMFASVGDPNAGWWMLMSRDQSLLLSPAMRRGTQPVQPNDRAPLWTDDHVNLMQVIRW
jgi:hypothetical protein